MAKELRRLAGKIIADDSKKRQRLHVYGWSTLVAFATNFLETNKASMGGDDGAGGPHDVQPLTRAQTDVLAALYEGRNVKTGAQTWRALEKRGLIIGDGDKWELTAAGVTAARDHGDR